MYSDETVLLSLKQAREEAGLTQKDVERRLDLRALTMRDYEVGRLKLPITMAMQLAELYGVTLEQLVGHETRTYEVKQLHFLANFTSIFEGSRYQLMFSDPILRAFFEDRRDDFFDQSAFDVLTQSLSSKQKQELITHTAKILFSLAAADGKVSDHELLTIKYILSHFQMMKTYKEITTDEESNTSLVPLPACMESIEIRHFLVWLQFLFASVGEGVCPEELEFIERRAEELRVNRSNYLYIQEQFVKEKK